MFDRIEEDLSGFTSAERTPEETISALAEYRKSSALIFSTEIAQRHPDKWVAAYKGKLVAVEDDQQTLLEELREQSIPVAFAAVYFVATSDNYF